MEIGVCCAKTKTSTLFNSFKGNHILVPLLSLKCYLCRMGHVHSVSLLFLPIQLS